MTNGATNWSWKELEPLVTSLAEGAFEPIVCGGQAISFWAARYELGTIVSRDLDLMGDREEAVALSIKLNATIQYPNQYEMTILTAVIQGTWLGRSLNVEYLSNVPGLETEPEEISVRFPMGSGHALRVLHPVALCLAKLHALRFFDQSGRSDLPHLQLALRASNLWLGELAHAVPARALLLVHRWYRAIRVSGSRRVLLRHQLDWTSAVPLVELESVAQHRPEVRKFLDLQWPRLVKEVSF